MRFSIHFSKQYEIFYQFNISLWNDYAVMQYMHTYEVLKWINIMINLLDNFYSKRRKTQILHYRSDDNS